MVASSWHSPEKELISPVCNKLQPLAEPQAANCFRLRVDFWLSLRLTNLKSRENGVDRWFCGEGEAAEVNEGLA